MTSHVAHVTLCMQRFVQARCEAEEGKKLPIAAGVTGQNFPDFATMARAFRCGCNVMGAA
ncbi:hypothetical protein GJG85_24840 [Burkholderia sp. MS389]|nr:hypothetical protein [Burkholderia sp. AcTa6-5]OXI68901.1 hypothetical protein CFB44_28730 [Burkholderia sp. AU31280]QRR16573.1 hypothetical protein GJG85_24840 [Burkholderia sp. MS389]QVN13857.1 hypothetical protein JYG37_25665 [Burkholderia sp. LAS2]RQU34095.1 hypothetical protein DF147_27660 [Burkholderia cenocepacia]